jgi:hypothetical protein
MNNKLSFRDDESGTSVTLIVRGGRLVLRTEDANQDTVFATFDESESRAIAQWLQWYWSKEMAGVGEASPTARPSPDLCPLLTIAGVNEPGDDRQSYNIYAS